MILEIVKYGHPALRTKGVPVTKVDAQIKQLFGQLRGNPESCRRVLSVRNDQIGLVLFHQPIQPLADNGPARPPENVSNK